MSFLYRYCIQLQLVFLKSRLGLTSDPSLFILVQPQQHLYFLLWVINEARSTTSLWLRTDCIKGCSVCFSKARQRYESKTCVRWNTTVLAFGVTFYIHRKQRFPWNNILAMTLLFENWSVPLFWNPSTVAPRPCRICRILFGLLAAANCLLNVQLWLVQVTFARWDKKRGFCLQSPLCGLTQRPIQTTIWWYAMFHM